MNIYIGWLIGAIIFGLFLTWGILIDKKIGKDEFYANYSTFLDLAKFFIPLSGLVLAYPFVFNNEPHVTIIAWERVENDFFHACVFEVAMLFAFFIPLFYRKTKLERTDAALCEAFLKGAIEYGVDNNHFEPHHSYKVKVNQLHMKAPLYYMYEWSRDYHHTDEVTLIDEETNEKIVMSMNNLWLRLCPMGKTGYIVFPWEVKWPKGTFPKKEFQKWCKVRGIKNVSVS